MVILVRRREFRFGKRRIGLYKFLLVKGYKRRKVEKAKFCFSFLLNVFFESDIFCYN